MHGQDRIVISDDDTGFRPKFIHARTQVSQKCELWPQIQHVKDIGIVIQRVKSVGVERQQPAKMLLGGD